MCDTILATPDGAANAAMLFGKNSDRQRNEAQLVEHIAAGKHAPNATLTCTYITIPQASRTHAVLLCRPFWIWGAEMGANEHGVVIGNEGLHARLPPPQADALTGMDLLRLALERAACASEAVQVITTLLERYGQGGNCGHLTPSYYNNGFMIADASEAYVLETIGKEWLVEQVRGVRAMSNRYSVEREPQRVSAGLGTLIQSCGWGPATPENYAEVIADPNREHIGNAGARRACSTSLLQSRQGRLNAADMISILRDHGAGESFQPEWRADCMVRRTVCMHAADEERSGQTVGSMVSELYSDTAVHWVTGTAAPCISIFKPCMIGAPLPAHGPAPSGSFDASTLWWRHERLHRSVLLDDFAKVLEDIRPERDALEADFRSRMKSVMQDTRERSQVIDACWREAIQMEDRWAQRMQAIQRHSGTAYASAWTRMNEVAGLTPCD